MSSFKLKDRIDTYQSQSEYKLLARLPIVIIINGRSFAKVTSLLDKPYSDAFSQCMASTSLKLCTEIEGCIFAYQHNDEIVLISRNDQSNDTLPWLDNKIQKISSIVSSIATLHFNKCVAGSDLNLLGDPHFTAKTFTVPTIAEAINTIIYKQQQNFYNSIHFACFYELLKKYDKNFIKEMLQGLSFDEKVNLLYQECEIDYNQYPSSFRRGIACYKVPKVIDQSVKNKWFINDSVPIFAKDQAFLTNIFKMGHDMFRVDS